VASARSQRISIWIIVIVLTLGTFLSFFAIILDNKNTATQSAHINQLTQQYQAAVSAQTKQLSDKYYSQFSQYSSLVGKYDASGVSDVSTQDLVVGTGDTINEDSSYAAYYIGWLPDGTIFDQSISNGALKQPLSVTPGGVISGWTKGTTGMKIGGVREITMTSAEGYGSNGQGSIPANSPLRFVIMVIPTPPTIPVPEDLVKYYQNGGQ